VTRCVLEEVEMILTTKGLVQKKQMLRRSVSRLENRGTIDNSVLYRNWALERITC